MRCGPGAAHRRYAVRSDLDNNQLKLGCTAAFGLVRGLGQAESFLRADTQVKALQATQDAAAGAAGAGDFLLGHSLTALAQAALCVGESVVVFFWTVRRTTLLLLVAVTHPSQPAGDDPFCSRQLLTRI